MEKNKELLEKFEQLQKDLLKHKYFYYIKSISIITDYNYDMMERESKKIAQQLGFRADDWEGPTPDEAHHVHWMVDFDDKHPLAKEVIEQAEEFLKSKGK